MGTEIALGPKPSVFSNGVAVKLNNPQMGTEIIKTGIMYNNSVVR